MRKRYTIATLALALVASTLAARAVTNHSGRGCESLPPGSTREILTLVPSATRPGVLYASADDGTLYVSRDGGRDWPTTRKHTPGWVIADFGTPNHDLLIEKREPEGLFASADGGRTWKTWSCSWSVSSISASEDGRTVWVATGVPLAASETADDVGGLYASLDGGVSWSHNVSLPSANVNAVLVDPTNPDTVLAATEAGGVSRTTDGGEHFEWRTVGRPSLGLPHGAQVTVLTTSAARPGIVWAGTRDAGVFRGVQDGERWGQSGLAKRYVDYLVADAELPNRLFAGTGQLAPCAGGTGAPLRDKTGTYLAPDGGHWKTIRALPGENQLAVADQGSSSKVYAWCNHDIFSTDDHGASWWRGHVP